MRTLKLSENTKKDLLNDLLKRSPNNYGQYETVVADIIAQVREKGDEAVFALTSKFDHCEITPDTLKVTKEEIEEAYAQAGNEFVEVMQKSAENIRLFHEKQLRSSWFDPRPDGTILGMKNASHCHGRSVCARRQSGLSLQRADECNSCQSGWC